MPARRKSHRKRRRRIDYVDVGKQIYRDVVKLKRFINVEFKFHDVQLTAAALAVAPVITQLSNIDQGDTTLTRDGAQLKCLSLQLSYSLFQSASATSSLVRVLLVKDKQTNQAIYTAGDLLFDVTAGDGIVSPYNRNNRRRFTILHDKVYTFSATGTTVKHFGRKFRQDQIIRYDNSGNGIADLTQSSYSLVMLTNEATNVPTVTMFSRLNYVDN